MRYANRVADAIKKAGGQTEIANACEKSQPTVFGWTRNGLPRTEYTGETDYASVIARKALEKGHSEFTREYLLGLPEPELAAAG